MNLTDSQKVLLAKLYYCNPGRYKEKLDELGAPESELLEYINKEYDRRKALRAIESLSSAGTQSTKRNPSINSGYNYSMGGRPYWSSTPIISRNTAAENTNKNSDKEKRVYIVVDGDNYPHQNMKGYEKIKDRTDYVVDVYVADDVLASQYEAYYHVSTHKVASGNQAVDNRIKAIVGNKAKDHDFKKIAIISRDQGYREKIKEWKKKYNWKKENIVLCKNIEAAI